MQPDGLCLAKLRWDSGLHCRACRAPENGPLLSARLNTCIPSSPVASLDGVHLDRTDRLCVVCKSLDCVEDEQHFVFDCPAYLYNHIRSQHLNLLQHCCTIADFMAFCEPNTCGGFFRECFACSKQILSV